MLLNSVADPGNGSENFFLLYLVSEHFFILDPGS
jgi:hypothetical protein